MKVTSVINRYPENALLDMGISSIDIEKYSFCLISNLYSLIRGGLFVSTRYIIFKQYYIDGYSLQDISSNLGYSCNRVKRELSRIKHTLRNNAPKVIPDTIKDYSNEDLIDLDDELEDDVIPFAKYNPYLVDIEDIDLSVRAYNCLIRAGIQNMGDIRDLGIEGLQRVRNLGSKSIIEIVAALKRYDISI